MEINFKLNGKEVKIDVDPAKRLLDVLRYDFNLTGVKEGCGEGECGACSILLNGKLVNSCLIPVGMVDGDEIITIEGVQYLDSYKDLYTKIEKAYKEKGAVQCGFCTPGMVMATIFLLKTNSNPSKEEIKEGLSGNLCRCTGYKKIVDAVEYTIDLLKEKQK